MSGQSSTGVKFFPTGRTEEGAILRVWGITLRTATPIASSTHGCWGVSPVIDDKLLTDAASIGGKVLMTLIMKPATPSLLNLVTEEEGVWVMGRLRRKVRRTWRGPR